MNARAPLVGPARLDMLDRLRRSPVLRHIELSSLDRLLSCSRTIEVPAGSLAIEEGGDGASLLLILDGQVAVYRPVAGRESSILAVRGRGDWIGESALLEGQRRSADVVAQRPTTLLEVPAEHFLDAAVGNAAAILDLIRTLNDRQRESDRLLIEALGRKERVLRASNQALRRQNRRLRSRSDSQGPFAQFLGESSAAERVRAAALRAADSEQPVLLLGETGTGKEILANGIHEASDRGGGPFLALNCALFTDSMLESELFGHTRGAFTGATASKPGLVEAAENGTLFLDEIGDMPLPLQGALLRFLELGEFRRLGDTRIRHARPRILAATAVNLDDAVEHGSFRRDLLYRLDVLRIDIPPLRDRPGDVGVLMACISQAIARRLGVPPLRFEESAFLALDRYPFPGNVRELSSELERLYAMHLEQGAVEARDLSAKFQRAEVRNARTYGEAVRRFKRDLVAAALHDAGGNQAEAARRLGIQPSNLSRMIRALGLAPRRER